MGVLWISVSLLVQRITSTVWQKAGWGLISVTTTTMVLWTSSSRTSPTKQIHSTITPPTVPLIDFTNIAGLGEVSFLKLAFGTKFFDADNDGALDLFVVNGHLYPTESDALEYAQTDQLFHQHRGGHFRGCLRAVRRVFLD